MTKAGRSFKFCFFFAVAVVKKLISRFYCSESSPFICLARLFFVSRNELFLPKLGDSLLGEQSGVFSSYKIENTFSSYLLRPRRLSPKNSGRKKDFNRQMSWRREEGGIYPSSLSLSLSLSLSQLDSGGKGHLHVFPLPFRPKRSL